MSLGTANRDGGKTSESGHLRPIQKGFNAEVLTGLNVSQRGAGANMSVDIAIGDAIIPRSDGTYGHPVFNDATLNQSITTADPSNPRRDIVVMYIDYGQTPSSSVSNNTNGVVAIKVVSGTPAGSPVDPTDSAIQSSVGSGNPFIKLARARVGAGVTSIGNSVIDDMRRMATGHQQGGWVYDATNQWVYVSASSFKIAGSDVRTQFPIGTKIQIYQAGVVAYFVVTATAYSTDTTVTVDGKGSYSISNIPIDKPAYSYMLKPKGYPFPGVQASNIDFTTGVWWEELGRTTLGVAGSNIAISSFAAKKYLRIIIMTTGNGLITQYVTFNGDNGANYAARRSINGGADTTGASQNNVLLTSGDSNSTSITVCDIVNFLAAEKLLTGQVSISAAGAGTIPPRVEIAAKWANTSNQITSVAITNSNTGNFVVGSEIIVLGHD